MISKIRGKIIEQKGNVILIEVGGLSYEVLIPEVILDSILKESDPDGEICLTTFHYLQITPTRSIPILVGFRDEVEKEFFTMFISVSGVGPKIAVKALNRPLSHIADAIDKADTSLLSSLPGIGIRKAKEIIAKLQGKVGKYGLIQDRNIKIKEDKVGDDIKHEAMQVLLQLRYKKLEAEDMINKALEQNPKLSSAEEILNQVYKHKKNI